MVAWTGGIAGKESRDPKGGRHDHRKHSGIRLMAERLTYIGPCAVTIRVWRSAIDKNSWFSDIKLDFEVTENGSTEIRIAQSRHWPTRAEAQAHVKAVLTSVRSADTTRTLAELQNLLVDAPPRLASATEVLRERLKRTAAKRKA